MKVALMPYDASDFPIETVLDILDKVYPYHPMADVTAKEPFKVLICCLLSLRSLDAVTMPSCSRLFREADTPKAMLELPEERLLALIYPVRFYENKVQILRHVCQTLLERFGGQVPDTLEALESIKGVGLKTANLVLSLGFGKPAIAVDTHVHRICNRLGYVSTKTPEKTEEILREKLPLPYWNMINRVMVRHGQEICRPIRPKCPVCPVNMYCMKVGVEKNRLFQ